MHYALTLKKIGGSSADITKDTYTPVWELFRKHNIELKHVQSEMDSNLRLHYHGIAIIPKNFYRKKLCLQGFHTNLIPLKTRGDYDRWLKYCYKDVPPEDWPDLCDDDPPYKIKKGLKEKITSQNIFRCCNNNTVTIESP